MHILLTGGTGLIGRALCRHWLAAGHQLSVYGAAAPSRLPRCAVHRYAVSDASGTG